MKAPLFALFLLMAAPALGEESLFHGALARAVIAALSDLAGYIMMFAPLPYVGGLGGMLVRSLATPLAASWELSAPAPALTVRF